MARLRVLAPHAADQLRTVMGADFTIQPLLNKNKAVSSPVKTPALLPKILFGLSAGLYLASPS
ncbi:MAG: hypothetical protein EOS26_14655 [Mesorhizobium sp.]|nr:hypothetical protein EOA85_10335 [Mesorhizobium sp. M5C.F.Ca.IN.020.29.1.1]RWF75572.1 MAG: hypothetical protein EOS26_14655 [Mesorhizobium sp.]TIM90396.1 MAG: hypothetical protein E5Y50_02245 [Mesorhizobium sp.]